MQTHTEAADLNPPNRTGLRCVTWSFSSILCFRQRQENFRSGEIIRWTITLVCQTLLVLLIPFDLLEHWVKLHNNYSNYSKNNWNNSSSHHPSPRRLTTQTDIDLLLCLMVDFLLCGDTAIAASFFHSSFEGDGETISYFRDLWLFRKNGLIVTVPPLHWRFRGSILNITLKQRPVIFFFKVCNRRLWSCTKFGISEICKRPRAELTNPYLSPT